MLQYAYARTYVSRRTPPPRTTAIGFVAALHVVLIFTLINALKPVDKPAPPPGPIITSVDVDTPPTTVIPPPPRPNVPAPEVPNVPTVTIVRPTAPTAGTITLPVPVPNTPATPTAAVTRTPARRSPERRPGPFTRRSPAALGNREQSAYA